MKLRTKTLSLVIAVFVASALVLFGVVSSTLLKSYLKIEEQRAYRDLQRLQKVFSADLQQNFTIIEDYASWDDTYDFAQNPDQAYIESNMSGDTFSSLGLNFIVLLNEAGEELFSAGHDFDAGTTIPVPERLLHQLIQDGSLLEDGHDGRADFGLLRIDSNILMVGIAPILRSDDTGPPQGSIVVGRYLDRKKLKELQQLTQLDIDYDVVGTDRDTQRQQSIISNLIGQTRGRSFSMSAAPTSLETVTDDTQIGYLLMPDIEGSPLLLWSVTLSRDIYQQGTTSLSYLLMSMAIIGIVLIGCIVVLLERLVLTRLTRLSGEVSHIGQSNDLSSRVHSGGTDELGQLGKSVNWMLEQLQTSKQELVEEHDRAEGLLLNILPASIADQLKKTHEPIANTHEEVTVLFADIVGFTQMSAAMEPVELVSILNEVFSKFDEIAEHLGLEKIKTIGDAYMVVAGLPESRDDHAQAVAQMALSMREALRELSAGLGHSLQIRIGINTGVVVAGVIGKKKFIYDLWGDAVNIASRMESSGEAGMIQVTEATYLRIRDSFKMEKRGVIDIKGRGGMATFLLKGRADHVTSDG